VLRQWIAAGARYEPNAAPRLTRLEVVPPKVRLAPDQKAALRTVAWFSDGTREEVTPLTTWASNDDSVARVDDAGRSPLARPVIQRSSSATRAGW
jgi:hypothetical protein